MLFLLDFLANWTNLPRFGVAEWRQCGHCMKEKNSGTLPKECPLIKLMFDPWPWHCSVTLVAEISMECRFPGARLKCRDFIEGNSVGWPRCTWKQFEDGFFEQYRSWPWILSPWQKEFRRWYWALYITLVCHLHVCLSECLSNKISNPWLSPGVTISVFRVSDVPWRAEFNES